MVDTGTPISDERKKEIAFEYKQLTEQGRDDEEATDEVCRKYGISEGQLAQIIAGTDEDDELEDAEFKDIEDEEKDPQPGD